MLKDGDSICSVIKLWIFARIKVGVQVVVFSRMNIDCLGHFRLKTYQQKVEKQIKRQWQYWF